MYFINSDLRKTCKRSSVSSDIVWPGYEDTNETLSQYFITSFYTVKGTENIMYCVGSDDIFVNLGTEFVAIFEDK